MNGAGHGGRVSWEEVGPLYAPAMVGAVEARLARGGLPDLVDRGPFLR